MVSAVEAYGELFNSSREDRTMDAQLDRIMKVAERPSPVMVKGRGPGSGIATASAISTSSRGGP